uniref:Uncharacterized protein n=1 Tax=Romanomermis culicivorax TaxID=13658 RepID=A0A915ITB5_ROMCU
TTSVILKKSTTLDHTSQKTTTETTVDTKSEIYPQTDGPVSTTLALSERPMNGEISQNLEHVDNEMDPIRVPYPTTEDSLARIGTDRVVDAFGNKRIVLKATTPEP